MWMFWLVASMGGIVFPDAASGGGVALAVGRAGEVDLRGVPRTPPGRAPPPAPASRPEDSLTRSGPAPAPLFCGLILYL
jgi:hypothetical protein